MVGIFPTRIISVFTMFGPLKLSGTIEGTGTVVRMLFNINVGPVDSCVFVSDYFTIRRF